MLPSIASTRSRTRFRGRRGERLPREESDVEPEVRLLGYLVLASILITLLLILLPIFEAMSVDPRLQLSISFVFLFALALIMLRLVLPSRERGPVEAQHHGTERVEGDVESTEKLLEDALSGSDYSKYMALKQLRDIAVNRVILRLHLGREEAEALMGDERWLRNVLKDEALARVVAHDFHGTPHGQMERALLGDVFESFDVKFPELLTKVEEMR
jgi:hypothetical protein